jgi:hypothetical protein
MEQFPVGGKQEIMRLLSNSASHIRYTGALKGFLRRAHGSALLRMFRTPARLIQSAGESTVLLLSRSRNGLLVTGCGTGVQFHLSYKNRSMNVMGILRQQATSRSNKPSSAQILIR